MASDVRPYALGMLSTERQQELQALMNLARALTVEAGDGAVAITAQNRAKAHLDLINLRIAELNAHAALKDVFP